MIHASNLTSPQLGVEVDQVFGGERPVTEIILLVNDRTHKPYRVKVDGFILLDSKGEPKRFSSTLKAMSFAQRYAEKKGK